MDLREQILRDYVELCLRAAEAAMDGVAMPPVPLNPEVAELERIYALESPHA